MHTSRSAQGGVRQSSASKREAIAAGSKRCSRYPVQACMSKTDRPQVNPEPASAVLSRRTLLSVPTMAAVVGLSLTSFPALTPLPAQAEEASTRYEDAVDKFSLTVPNGWVSAEGTASNSRRTVAFYNPEVPLNDLNVSVVVTNTSVEFTGLGSFGNVATFAGNLVNSLDRSYLMRTPSWVKKSTEPVQIARLVDYKDSRGQYFVEYTIQKMPEPEKHLLSTVALGSNGVYNRLYTVTAQCGEKDIATYRPLLQAVVDSFKSNLPATA